MEILYKKLRNPIFNTGIIKYIRIKRYNNNNGIPYPAGIKSFQMSSIFYSTNKQQHFFFTFFNRQNKNYILQKTWQYALPAWQSYYCVPVPGYGHMHHRIPMSACM